MANIQQTQTFDQLIGKFRAATTASLQLAETLSKMALQHFANHGDTAYLNRFLDAMPKNYLRRGAFEKWCKDFAPITKADGVLIKDKSKDANPLNLEAAFKKPFWEHSPDKEVVFWNENDIIVSLQKALKRFDNTKAFKPVDIKAVKALEHFKAQVNAVVEANTEASHHAAVTLAAAHVEPAAEAMSETAETVAA